MVIGNTHVTHLHVSYGKLVYLNQKKQIQLVLVTKGYRCSTELTYEMRRNGGLLAGLSHTCPPPVPYSLSFLNPAIFPYIQRLKNESDDRNPCSKAI